MTDAGALPAQVPMHVSRVAAHALDALGQEITEIRLSGPRAHQATMTALAVALSVAVACAMHVPDIWWAAISGFISTQATRPASIRKALLRITGTAAGAGLGLVLAGWLAYDHAACCLALLVASALGALGAVVSPHGYAWLFFGITFSLVVLLSLADPFNAFGFAVYRTLEVGIGTTVAMVVAIALAPEGSPGHGDAEPPGWADLLGGQWPLVLHALRSGIVVAMVPLAWSSFNLPGLPAIAITVATVLAIPVPSGHAMDDGPKIIERATHRLLGCFVGGIAGLVLLALSLDQLLPWLAILAASVWLSAYVQSSTRGIGYVGIQAAVVLVITLVQGEGPPTSILPGVDRFVGIMLGLAMLFVVSLVVQPAAES